MPSLTIPNRWGEEGFNVIRTAIIEYCNSVGTPVDLGYAFQWDNSVMLIRDGEGLDELTYANCNVALQRIYHFLCLYDDPWKAVKEAREEWQKELAETEEAMREMQENSQPPTGQRHS